MSLHSILAFNPGFHMIAISKSKSKFLKHFFEFRSQRYSSRKPYDLNHMKPNQATFGSNSLQSVAVLGGGQGGHDPRPRAFFNQKGPRKREENAKCSIDNVKYGHIKGL